MYDRVNINKNEGKRFIKGFEIWYTKRGIKQSCVHVSKGLKKKREKEINEGNYCDNSY